jgi:pimeloyl-ACP methyl ester carboxylesterase
MRARHPDLEGHVEREGVRIGYESFGSGDAVVLLFPTWTIVHSRFWKLQVPYLARHFRVITFDGPGNGRSDRTTDPAHFASDAYAGYAAAVLAELEVETVVAVGLSRGAEYVLRFAALHPTTVQALVLVGSALPLVDQTPDRIESARHFHDHYPEDPQGWEKYNLAYWRDHYRDFADFFFSETFSEPHSTKQQEDAVGWAMETSPDVLAAEAHRPGHGLTGPELFEGIHHPTLVVHGTEDRIHRHEVGEEAARLSGGELSSMAGSGHIPTARDPVRFNLILRQFVERVAS